MKRAGKSLENREVEDVKKLKEINWKRREQRVNGKGKHEFRRLVKDSD